MAVVKVVSIVVARFPVAPFLFSLLFGVALLSKTVRHKGCQEYLTKTVNFDILEQIVREFRTENELISSLILE
jgi:hypothetical protein